MLPPYAQERELSHRHRTHHHTLVVITLIIIVVIVIIPRSITMPMVILVIIIIIHDIIMVITLIFIPQWLALHLMDFPHPRLFAVLLSLRGKTEARFKGPSKKLSERRARIPWSPCVLSSTSSLQPSPQGSADRTEMATPVVSPRNLEKQQQQQHRYQQHIRISCA